MKLIFVARKFVRGVLDHLGREHIHDEDRVALTDEGLVEIVHEFAGALIVHADHDAGRGG